MDKPYGGLCLSNTYDEKTKGDHTSEACLYQIFTGTCGSGLEKSLGVKVNGHVWMGPLCKKQTVKA